MTTYRNPLFTWTRRVTNVDNWVNAKWDGPGYYICSGFDDRSGYYPDCTSCYPGLGHTRDGSQHCLKCIQNLDGEIGDPVFTYSKIAKRLSPFSFTIRLVRFDDDGCDHTGDIGGTGKAYCWPCMYKWLTLHDAEREQVVQCPLHRAYTLNTNGECHQCSIPIIKTSSQPLLRRSARLATTSLS